MNFKMGSPKYCVVKFEVPSGRNVDEAHITYLFLQVGTSILKIFGKSCVPAPARYYLRMSIEMDRTLDLNVLTYGSTFNLDNVTLTILTHSTFINLYESALK